MENFENTEHIQTAFRAVAVQLSFSELHKYTVSTVVYKHR